MTDKRSTPLQKEIIERMYEAYSDKSDIPLPNSGGGNAVNVMVDNKYNIIECPLTYDELKERIESRKPLMINVFTEKCRINDDGSLFETVHYIYPSEEITMHYSYDDEGNYIMVKCRYAYYLEFYENGEITFYSVD